MHKLITFVLFVFLFISVKAQINMVVKPDGFLFLDGKDSVFFYRKIPKDLNGTFSRCNYIHPLYGPDGTRLTEDFPLDHLHHRGVFWAWHQIIIDGKTVSDGWELKNFEQKVTSFEYRLLKGVGVINTTVDWKSPIWKDGQVAYLKETSKIFIYPKVGNYRRIDFEVHLKSLEDHLKIGGSDDVKGYSGFSVRMKLPQDISFSGEKGIVEPENTAVKAGNIINMQGSILKGSKKGGIVMFSDPENPKPSDMWILRKSASMQNAVYPGRDPVSIPFDQPLILRYALLVYQGDLSQKQIKKALK